MFSIMVEVIYILPIVYKGLWINFYDVLFSERSMRIQISF